MAFDYTKWQRWSSGFDLSNNAMWNYTDTATTAATIAGANYFLPAYANLSVGDLIWVVASDTNQFLEVTVVSSSTVTTQPFNTVLGAGSVGTSNLAANAVTTAKITDANVTSAKLEDLLVHYARVTMTAVEWDGMYVTPKALVAAPGASKKLIPMRVVINLDYGGTVFADGGAIHVQYDSTTLGAGPKATGTLAAATFIGYTADTSFGFTPVDTTLVDSTTLNKGLYLSNATGAFTGGTSSAFIVDTWYAIADYA